MPSTNGEAGRNHAHCDRNRVKSSEFAEWLGDRKNARMIPHRLEDCGTRSAHRNSGRQLTDSGRSRGPASRLCQTRAKRGEASRTGRKANRSMKARTHNASLGQ